MWWYLMLSGKLSPNTPSNELLSGAGHFTGIRKSFLVLSQTFE